MDSKLERKRTSGQSEDLKRKSIPAGLKNIYSALREYPSPNLDDGFLNKFHIKTSAPIDETVRTQFFVPLAPDKLDELWAKSEEWAKRDPEHNCDWPTFQDSSNYYAAYHFEYFLSGILARPLTDEGEMLYQHGPWKERM